MHACFLSKPSLLKSKFLDTFFLVFPEHLEALLLVVTTAIYHSETDILYLSDAEQVKKHLKLVQDLDSTTPFTPCHLLCLSFFKFYYPCITIVQLFIILCYTFTIVCNFLLASSSLFLSCAVHVRTRTLQMDVESLHCFMRNVNISPIALPHAHSPAYFRLWYLFSDKSCLKFSSLCYSQTTVIPESSLSLAGLIP